MDYYLIAEEPYAAAAALKDNGMFRMSVNMSTLAIDLLLKSVLYRLDSTSDYLLGHDHIGVFRVIEKQYPKQELRRIVKLSRKYFNDSRYSNSENFPSFTEELATNFIDYAKQIKDFVDNDCQASLLDLQKRFEK